MRMTLMHKDIPAAGLTAITGGYIIGAESLDRRHMPMGTYSDDPGIMAAKLRKWLSSRRIPDERQGKAALDKAIGRSTWEAMLMARGASLTDCYWLRDSGSADLSWKDASFIRNGFPQDAADAAIYGISASGDGLRSPDFTTGGALRKAWILQDGIPMLVKYGDFGPNAGGKNLLSANEIAASRIARMMGVRHVTYAAFRIRGTEETACASPCFIADDGTEFVTARQISEEYGLDGEGLYRFLQDAGMGPDADAMILFDHAIHNTDRHLDNFGVLRSPDTLEITGFAPLFDSGSSFGWNAAPGIRDMDETKPFRSGRIGQLRLAGACLAEAPDAADMILAVQEAYEELGIPEPAFRTAEADIARSLALLGQARDGR